MIELYSYSIPFNTPLKIKGGVLYEKKGYILNINGQLGDISPLPFFSKESLDDVHREILLFAKNRNNFFPTCPSLCFALYSINNPLEKVKRKRPYKLIMDVEQELFNNKIIPNEIYKIKVGLNSYQKDLYLLNKLLDYDIKLILDANCQLSYQKCLNLINVVNDKLLYFEDPCNNFSDCQKLPCKVAYDEYLRIDSNKAFLKNERQIIKPSLDLSFKNNKQNNYILSSIFESIVGISYIEKLSTYLNLNNPGTDTLKYFPKNAQKLDCFLSTFCKRISI